jgi:hypothetical protein
LAGGKIGTELLVKFFGCDCGLLITAGRLIARIISLKFIAEALGFA